MRQTTDLSGVLPPAALSYVVFPLTLYSSVPSSQWGEYKGTLVGVSHLDLINWTNRMKWWFWGLLGNTQT
jgi:hypothetical protein